MNNKFYNFLNITRKSGNVLIGYNKCEDAIKHGKMKLVMMTEDLSQNSKDKFTKYCYDRDITIIRDMDKEELNAYLCSKEIKIIGITDENMSNKLLDLWRTTNN
ncbi:Ribosomal protein L7Ae [Clostridium collagenovorans DSM 3089]|uniref:Ribosomal protein L7Ae n=1 Tax=Clostridium collagenovorans DSM 3089 TaxID=1121306 RepID=A0A1M5SX75_9CLOT|nr:ribosomal L7Ae/L30e/S12e/Gadd45 family protein [Clostridium collagenovorans]SHH42723.1 Ribosomal protein L7Ae [Clostridium collagenovorans DSM 3089]